MGRRSRPWQAAIWRDPDPPPGDVDWVRPTQLAAAATIVFGPLRFTATTGREREDRAPEDGPPRPNGGDSGHSVLLQ